jgi:hypothetical protein
MTKLRRLKMKTMRRYRDECEGEWKWLVTARTNMINVRRAATGCRMRRYDSVVRVDDGRSKEAESSSEKTPDVS